METSQEPTARKESNGPGEKEPVTWAKMGEQRDRTIRGKDFIPPAYLILH